MADKANEAYDYYCRICGAMVFRVSWYTAPRNLRNEELSPGWAITCTGCGRTTLIPAEPDLTEMRRTQ